MGRRDVVQPAVGAVRCVLNSYKEIPIPKSISEITILAPISPAPPPPVRASHSTPLSESSGRILLENFTSNNHFSADIWDIYKIWIKQPRIDHISGHNIKLFYWDFYEYKKLSETKEKGLVMKKFQQFISAFLRRWQFDNVNTLRTLGAPAECARTTWTRVLHRETAFAHYNFSQQIGNCLKNEQSERR